MFSVCPICHCVAMCTFLVFGFFFFFKQKTAYEMRISDWSSDVCSSDLVRRLADLEPHPQPQPDKHRRRQEWNAPAPCGEIGIAQPQAEQQEDRKSVV